MKFQVPQFIEVEDKIFGPLTFKQFIYVAGGLGLSVLAYFFLPLLIAIPVILAVLGLSAALAFYKVNNKPFIFFVESSIKYLAGGKLYVWRKKPREAKPEAKKDINNKDIALDVPRLSDSKLKDLAWSLDVENVNSSDINKK